MCLNCGVLLKPMPAPDVVVADGRTGLRSAVDQRSISMGYVPRFNAVISISWRLFNWLGDGYLDRGHDRLWTVAHASAPLEEGLWTRTAGQAALTSHDTLNAIHTFCPITR